MTGLLSSRNATSILQVGLFLLLSLSANDVAKGWNLLVVLQNNNMDTPCRKIQSQSLKVAEIASERTDNNGILPTTKTTTATRTSRRQTFQAASTILLASTIGSVITANPTQALARNLPESTGADTSNTGTVATLIPIAEVRNKVQQLDSDITTAVKTLPKFPTGLPRDERAFKRILDAYSEPVSYKQKFVDSNAFLVYYTKGFDGPGRQSIEDDLPVKQTMQYGARNDAWVAWEEVIIEYDFAVKELQKNGDEVDWDKADIQKPLQRTLQALDAYLSLAPSEDLQEATKRLMAGAR